MKIAYVTMQFPVASETFAAVELRALRRRGAEVTVLAYRAAPPGAAALLAERGLTDLSIEQGGAGAILKGLLLVLLRPGDSLFLISAILRHCWRRPQHLVKALALVPRSLTLLQRIEALKPQVVHLFWGHYPSLLGLLVKRRRPEALLSLFLGAYDLERRFPLSALLAGQADVLLTHARANLPALAAIGVDPADVTVAYRGLEIPTPPPAPQKTRALMVLAERLVPQKSTDAALRLFAAVARQVPEARLRVLGKGPESGRLQALSRELGIADKVTFAGHVPHQEVFHHLAEAEVALTLSQSPSERLPNAIKEAMLHRCLCLAARSTGIEELISDGETGLLVDAGDLDGAARRLTGLLGDAAAMARIGAQAQARILADFDADRLMAERLERWSALLQERQPGAAA